MHGSGCCLECHVKPKLITLIDEPLRGERIEGQPVLKHRMLEDFWTTSACEMDNGAVQSWGIVSSINASNHTIDLHGTSSMNTLSGFVNHGLLLWNQTRQQWVGNKRCENRAGQLREPKLSWSATYDSLLGSNKPFP